MAELHEAQEQTAAGVRRVVLKRLRPELVGDAQLREMFRHEARLQRALDHRNLIACHALTEHDGEPVLVLEHVDGCALDQVIARARVDQRALEPSLAAWIGRELCRALEAIHALSDEAGRPLNAVPRDVTPANLLLSRAGAVKLGDLGVAKSLWSRARTLSGEVKGSPRYLSPEQAQGDHAGPLSDLFGVGLLLFEALALAPYRQGDARELLNAATRSTWRPLRAINAAVPPELEKLIQRCLRVDPETRPASASALAAALSRVIAAAPQLPGAAEVSALVEQTLSGPTGPSAPSPAETTAVGPPSVVSGPTVSLLQPGQRAVLLAARARARRSAEHPGEDEEPG